MHVQKLELLHIAVPLRSKIKHASHERTESDSMIARVTLSDGTIGHGEGVPRSYVTGETIGTAFEALSKVDVARSIGDPQAFQEAVKATAAVTLDEIEADPRGMFGNAARCALELALLDAFGRAFNQSLSDAVDQLAGPGRTPVDWVRYSGAVTSQTVRAERISAWKMRVYGFKQVKVKVGVPEQNDPYRMRTFRRIMGKRMNIRLDANEAWDAENLVERMSELRFANPSAIEQPLPHAQLDRLADLRAKLGAPVMLDESLCSLSDARTAFEKKAADIYNVRVSKCGGIAPLLRIVSYALERGVRLQLGCHPGETGLLSAAGRHLASRAPVFDFVEGSYDRHVLGETITAPDVTFGYGGWARAIPGPGLGAAPVDGVLDRLTRRSLAVEYD